MDDRDLRLSCLQSARDAGAALGYETAEAQRIYDWVTGKVPTPSGETARKHPVGSFASLQARAEELGVHAQFGWHMSPDQYFSAIGRISDAMFRRMDIYMRAMETLEGALNKARDG